MAKFFITMKDPDYGIDIEGSPRTLNANEMKLLEKFVEWNEYVTIEFDSDSKTARVVTVKESKGGR